MSACSRLPGSVSFLAPLQSSCFHGLLHYRYHTIDIILRSMIIYDIILSLCCISLQVLFQVPATELATLFWHMRPSAFQHPMPADKIKILRVQIKHYTVVVQ